MQKNYQLSWMVTKSFMKLRKIYQKNLLIIRHVIVYVVLNLYLLCPVKGCSIWMEVESNCPLISKSILLREAGAGKLLSLPLLLILSGVIRNSRTVFLLLLYTKEIQLFQVSTKGPSPYHRKQGDWLGGVKNWQFLLKFSSIHVFVGCVGQKMSKNVLT